jgi:hypothetical protein
LVKIDLKIRKKNQKFRGYDEFGLFDKYSRNKKFQFFIEKTYNPKKNEFGILQRFLRSFRGTGTNRHRPAQDRHRLAQDRHRPAPTGTGPTPTIFDRF